MQEKHAKSKGFIYVGHYSRDRAEIKNKLNEIKNAGYHAMIIDVPDSPYSRSSCIGKDYSIYAEPKYVRDLSIKDYRFIIARHSQEINNLTVKHKNEMDNLLSVHSEHIKRLNEMLAQNP